MSDKTKKSKSKEGGREGGRTSIAINKKAIKEAEKLMKDLIKMFEVDADFEVSDGSYTNADDGDESYIDIKVSGENIGVLIGYMGRNLRSLQRIVGQILSRRLKVASDEGEFLRVVIDVSGYREKREESLKRMAENVREEVLASMDADDMPSMSAYERRVIHTHLQEFDDVTTESFGEGRDRHVRVLPVGGEEKATEEKAAEKKVSDSGIVDESDDDTVAIGNEL